MGADSDDVGTGGVASTGWPWVAIGPSEKRQSQTSSLWSVRRHHCRVQLPAWIDEPVPAVELDEHHDAVGKLVIATQELEVWLAFFTYRLGATPSYADSARLRATQQVVKIRQSVENVPAQDRDDLRAVLRRTSSILDFRNAVVHAMYRRYEDGVSRQEHRLQPPPREHFTVEMLIGAAFAAQSVVDYFHSRVGLWPQVPIDK